MVVQKRRLGKVKEVGGGGGGREGDGSELEWEK